MLFLSDETAIFAASYVALFAKCPATRLIGDLCELSHYELTMEITQFAVMRLCVRVFLIKDAVAFPCWDSSGFDGPKLNESLG
jgi:hypothetical protein